ncbi:MAG: D-alanyl-D-alanine carboxypeptidase [Phenylobacterium sp.]|uniref:D-alanyl-D-alanine carboxypeptidase n=1 Tax=Phenylobacterium sp. TaxID=1871053 RepID=UPI002734E11C|nr:D-alanyl-D-alanine carboxypeptidase [Phenylobacterium sp.]MDP3175954.1 D-alanyl-D-alanine carboxypeptidase [Phenylobacterium sp.]
MIKPARRLLLSIGFAVAAATAAIAPQAYAQIPYLQLPTNEPKYAAIVVDAKTGEVMYAKRADSPRYPASITKVMTLYLTFEALASGKLQPDDRVVFSPHAAAQSPTKLGVAAGDSISVSDAMQAMAIKSANDAAVAMAEKLGGTESRFAALMTLRARELGMQNTRFVNASGLPDSRQLTTARDIAILSRSVMRDYPQYYKLFSQQQFAFRGQLMRNHNGLLFRMPGVDGLKTGFTNASGYNLAVSAVRGNRRLIGVVMGGSSNAARDNNAQDLLLTGFNIIARRNRGEQITVAQNMFEPEPAGSVMRPSIEQGDRDQDTRIMLASATPPAKLASLKIVESDKTRLKNEKAEKKAKADERKNKKRGEWAVQVGSFKSKSDAKEQLSFVRNRFGKQFAQADGQVADRAAGTYRSRFNGFSESSAKAACSALKAKKLACQVISPS